MLNPQKSVKTTVDYHLGAKELPSARSNAKIGPEMTEIGRNHRRGGRVKKAQPGSTSAKTCRNDYRLEHFSNPGQNGFDRLKSLTF